MDKVVAKRLQTRSVNYTNKDNNNNLTRQDREALVSLLARKEFIVKPANKGKSMVMDKMFYEHEIEIQRSDLKTCCP